MKKFLIFPFIALVVLAIYFLSTREYVNYVVNTTPDQAGEPFRLEYSRVELIRVKDGDSFIVKYEGKETELRLVGIDAPELRQPYGKEAKENLEKLLVLFKNGYQIGFIDTDGYGRRIAKVKVFNDYGDPEYDLSYEQLKAGLAWFYKAYSTSTEYAAVEAIARYDKKGLWSQSNPTPPWEFRNK